MGDDDDYWVQKLLQHWRRRPKSFRQSMECSIRVSCGRVENMEGKD